MYIYVGKDYIMKHNRLKEFFPIIRERNEVLKEIKNDPGLLTVFSGWEEERQEEFLDICSGVRGVKLLYDSFFKEAMNPENDPARLSDFLSVVLQKRVHVLKVLPNDSVRIASESALLITDVVVEFCDGSIANVEVQKIGYLFTGERAACYSADLLLRQYKRLRDERKKNFRYGDIKTVYTVVLFEKSPKEFHAFPEDYVHYIQPASDTGLELNLLQKYCFIPLDIFTKCSHNRDRILQSELDAWLLFLSSDRPEDIIQIVEAYPRFQSIYGDIFELCRNTEAIMELFSKELQILDENTVRYMIDVMQDELDSDKELLEKKAAELSEMNEKLNKKDSEISQISEQLSEKDATIDELTLRIKELEQQLQSTQK